MLLLLTLFMNSAQAAVPQQWTPFPTNGTIYLDQTQCPAPCFELVEKGELKDIEIQSLQDVQVDDTSKPIYEAESNIKTCATESSCSDLIASKCADGTQDCDPSTQTTYCDSDHQAFYKKLDSGFEAYCTRFIRYDQKTVKKLVEDPTKKAAKLAKIQADKDADTIKETNKKTLRQRLKALATQGTLSATDKDEIIAKLIKLLLVKGDLD